MLYNAKADVYSLSLITYQMLQGAKPFQGMSRKDFFHHVVHRHFRPPVDAKWPAALTNLIVRSWDPDQLKRPTAREYVDAIDAILHSLHRHRRNSTGTNSSLARVRTMFQMMKERAEDYVAGGGTTAAGAGAGGGAEAEAPGSGERRRSSVVPAEEQHQQQQQPKQQQQQQQQQRQPRREERAAPTAVTPAPTRSPTPTGQVLIQQEEGEVPRKDTAAGAGAGAGAGAAMGAPDAGGQLVGEGGMHKRRNSY